MIKHQSATQESLVNTHGPLSLPWEIWKSIIIKTIAIYDRFHWRTPDLGDANISIRSMSCVSRSMSLLVHDVVVESFKYIGPGACNWSLSHFIHLKTLDLTFFSDCLKVTDDGLKNLTNLVSLRVYVDYDYQSNFSLQGITHLTNLEYLEIKGEGDYLNEYNYDFDEPSYRENSNMFLPFVANLTSLNLGSPCVKYFRDSDLLLLTNLTQLSLSRSHITNAVFSHLTCLQYLSLYQNQNITDEALVFLTNLTSLQLTEDSISGKNLNLLPNLRSLDLVRNVTFAAEDFSKLTNLTKLQLSYNCNRIMPWMNLTNLTHLEVIRDSQLNNEGLFVLSKLKKLVLIETNWISGKTLMNFTNLTDLDIDYTYFDLNLDLIPEIRLLGEAICTLNNLVRLSIFDSRIICNLQDTTAVAKNLSNLTELTLQDSRMTREFILQFSQQLRKLTVGPSIDDSLIMKFTNLTSLDLRNNFIISDHGIRNLTKLTSLRLDSRRFQPLITLEGIMNLTNLTDLRDHLFSNSSLMKEEVIRNFPYLLHPSIQESCFSFL